MVWAAEFVRQMGPYDSGADRPVDRAADRATALVAALRRARGRVSLHEDARAAVDDMLSTGGDR